ncbi:hypothetical protein [Nocardioides sp. SYSU DS0663]|uniref:hypothetical protein n=1 Tax=Nocardioides sp. SYSU DS0663 TaxID=3416445 RepID=UPI003F4C72F3
MDSATAETVTAIAAALTAMVALTALLLAYGQLAESRALRREQAQPYVVAFMESGGVSPHFVDLVVRNFGATAAFDVRVETKPNLQRSDGQGGVEDVQLFDALPTLVPGQEWRTFWDYSPERSNVDLTGRHEVVVTFSGADGRRFKPLRYVLDWNTFTNRRWVQQYGIHDAAKALREMQSTVKRWQDSPRGGLAVYTRDGDAVDQRRRDEAANARRRHEELTRRVISDSESASPDEAES